MTNQEKAKAWINRYLAALAAGDEFAFFKEHDAMAHCQDAELKAEMLKELERA